MDPNSTVTDSFIRSLAWGPSVEAKIWPAYFVNGYNFHTASYGEGKSTDNSGVCVKCSGYSNAEVDFYGVLEEVVELEFHGEMPMNVVLFKCKWIDPAKGMRVHPKYHVVEVCQKRPYQKYEPFILAQQAQQVYFAEYPSMTRKKKDWKVVSKIKARRNVEVRWKDASDAYQPDECTPAPIIETTEELPPLNDPAGIILPIDSEELSSNLNRSRHHDNDVENDEYDQIEEEDEEEDDYEDEDEVPVGEDEAEHMLSLIHI